MNIINASRPLRSRSQNKTGFIINPNELNTNFNKKDFIGFKMKLLENIKKNKKNFGKKEEDFEIEKKTIKYKRSNSEKKNNRESTRIHSNSDRIKDEKTVLIKDINQSSNSNTKLKSIIMKNLMDEADHLKELNIDLANLVKCDTNLINETKLLEIWIEIDTSVEENKSTYLISYLKKIFKCQLNFQKEYEIFSQNQFNKLFLRMINLSFIAASACLIACCTLHLDNSLKVHIRRLITNVLKSFLNFFLIFTPKKLNPLISEELIDKINKISSRDQFHNKYQLKHIDIISYLTKDLDTICFSIKQIAK